MTFGLGFCRWWDLPQRLGTSGGIEGATGMRGLLTFKRKQLSALKDERMTGMS